MNYKKYIDKAAPGVRRVKDCTLPLSCGFLLTRGLVGGARCAGWSMPALAGSMWGSLSGAVIFAAACALYRIARRDLGNRLSWLPQPVAAAVYTLYGLCASASSPILRLFDSAAVNAALLLTGRTRRLPLVLPMLLLTLTRLLPPVSGSPELLRLTALTGGISSAWLCGSAVCCLTEGEAPADWRLLTIGAAAAMILA